MPVLSVPIQPETKILLDGLSTLMQASASRVIEIIVASYIQALPDAEAQVIAGLKEAALNRLAADVHKTGKGRPAPAVTYKFSRLCFKRDLIEALGPNDSFRVETPIGVFQMTQADFHRAFPNVAQSRSYLDGGLYHYRTLPSQAERFRVA